MLEVVRKFIFSKRIYIIDVFLNIILVFENRILFLR